MSLTIQYCSDLHLEFDLNKKWISKYPLAVKGDVLLLAGDIAPFSNLQKHDDFFDFAASNFQATYWIPGNHEYYGADITERSGALYESIRNNVFLVNNTDIIIGDLTLICATLWSHINPLHEGEIRRAMSDFHVIESGEGKLDIAGYNRLHAAGRHYIEQSLAASATAHKVVMTHHVPTFMNYPEKFIGDALNSAFATELHGLIQGSNADCWLYGHTHCNTPDFKIGNTQVLTNQLGYVRYGEHKSFLNDKTIKI
jgi:predicted phosphohydrolase